MTYKGMTLFAMPRGSFKTLAVLKYLWESSAMFCGICSYGEYHSP